MRSEPRALLFDMDGLTVDTEPFWFRAEADVAARFGFSWTEADHHHCVGGPIEKMARHLGARGAMEERWPELADLVIAHVAEQARQGIEIKPGITDLVESARSAAIPLALVSGSPRIIVDAVIARLPFEYDAVVSCDDVTRTKPDPEPYLKAAAELGVAAEQCVAIEDSATGTRSAQSAGCWVFVVPSLPMESHPIEAGERGWVLPSLEGISIDRIRELIRTRG